jgi:hypothetical protein
MVALSRWDSKNSRVVNPDERSRYYTQGLVKHILKINENNSRPPFSLRFLGYSELLCVQDL